MKSWFSKNLGDAVLARDEQDRIEKLVEPAGAHGATSGELAAFFRHEAEGRLHCELIVYFSPMTATVARSVGAKPCRRPSPNGLSLFAGSDEAWSALFPEIIR